MSVRAPSQEPEVKLVYPFFAGHVKDPVPGNPEYAVMVFGTDSQVAEYNLVVMQDDKKFWPNYACAATMRGDWAAKYPDAVNAFNSIMPLLSNQAAAGGKDRGKGHLRRRRVPRHEKVGVVVKITNRRATLKFLDGLRRPATFTWRTRWIRESIGATSKCTPKSRLLAPASAPAHAELT